MTEALCFVAAAAVGGCVWFVLSLVMRDERATSMVVPTDVLPLRRRGATGPVPQPQQAQRGKADHSQRAPWLQLIPSLRGSRNGNTAEPQPMEQVATTSHPPSDSLIIAPTLAEAPPITQESSTIERDRVAAVVDVITNVAVQSSATPIGPSTEKHNASETAGSRKPLFGWLSFHKRSPQPKDQATIHVHPVPLTPELPAWIRGLVETTPNINERVRLLWLQVWIRQGNNLEAFLSLVESSDPELKPVAALARQQRRPLTLRSLQEAEEWIQQSA